MIPCPLLHLLTKYDPFKLFLSLSYFVLEFIVYFVVVFYLSPYRLNSFVKFLVSLLLRVNYLIVLYLTCVDFTLKIVFSFGRMSDVTTSFSFSSNLVNLYSISYIFWLYVVLWLLTGTFSLYVVLFFHNFFLGF